MRRRLLDIKRVILIFFLFILVLSFIQHFFSIINIEPLEGAAVHKKKPVISAAGWFSADYQSEAEAYLNENFGFRSSLIRLNNQIDFSVFGEAHADEIVVGKSNYLFQKPSINSYFGVDFLGADLIERKLQRLKFISDTLAKLDKNLIIVLGTGKGSYFPEFIPDRLKAKKNPSNIEYVAAYAKKFGIDCIDFNQYFVKLKNTSPYPLYPQYGIHWSRYGGYLAADSILHYIEAVRHIEIPRIILDSIEFRQPENEDYDIAGGMNLLFRLKSFDMAYPKFHYESDSGKTKPSVLVIGDSYYWGLSNMEISKAFSKNKFWFYYNRGTAGALKELSPDVKLSMAKEIQDFDVVILISTEFNLNEFWWGFIENTYCYYKGINLKNADEFLFDDDIEYFKERIKRDQRKMERVAEMAASENISVDSMLTLRAITRVKNKKNNIKGDRENR